MGVKMAEINLDVKNYAGAKKDGLIGVGKLNDAYVISIKRFNPKNGKPLPPNVLGVDITQLEAARDELLTQAAGIDAVIADLKALDVK